MKHSKYHRPTIYDVAALAGMSITTVSRVLNTPERVNETTRAKVQSAIDQLGFLPRAEARARALHGTHRIGVITPFFTAPSFVQRLRGIYTALAETNYELVIYTVDSLNKLQGYLGALPLVANLDGLIIVSLPFDEIAARRLAKHGPETVTIEYCQPNFSSITIDDFAGGRLAAEYLISHGHKQCAYIGDLHPPDYAIRPCISRLNGFRQGLADASLMLPDEYICSSNYTQEPTQRAARQLLLLPNPPTAIFAAADIQAVIVLRVARELGLDVPGDLAIIGFDDLDLADYVNLTTIRQPLDDSGRIAAELLLSRLNDPKRPVQSVNLPLTVVERGTV